MRGKQRHYLAKGNQKIRCFVVADFIVVVVFVAKFSFLSERAKGQFISKCLMVLSLSPKKRTKQFVFTTSRLVFVRFLGESEKT